MICRIPPPLARAYYTKCNYEGTKKYTQVDDISEFRKEKKKGITLFFPSLLPKHVAYLTKFPVLKRFLILEDAKLNIEKITGSQNC